MLGCSELNEAAQQAVADPACVLVLLLLRAVPVDVAQAAKGSFPVARLGAIGPGCGGV